MSGKIQNDLITAAEQGNIEKIRALMDKNIINYKNQSGYTALALAVRSGHLEIANELISHGADINSTNQAGQSVLFIACWHNQADCVKLLLNKGAIIDSSDQRGWTPLIISVYHNYANIVQILLDAGCDIDHKDSFGKKAIDRAKNIEMISLLQKSGAEKRKKSKANSLSLPGTPAKYEIQQPKEISTKNRSISPSVFSRSSSVSRNSIYIGSEKSDTSFKSNIRPTTPQKQSFQSPDTMKFDERKKIKNEIEKYLNKATSNFEKKFTEDWTKDLQFILDEEINKAEISLQNEVDKLLIKSSKDLLEKLRGFTLLTVDDIFLNNGISVVEFSPESYKSDADFFIQKSPPKLQGKDYTKNEESPIIQWPTFEGNYEHKDQIFKHIDSQFEELESKLNKFNMNQITKEINQRVAHLKQTLILNIQEEVVEIGKQIKTELEKIAHARIKDIIEMNNFRYESRLESSQDFSSNHSSVRKQMKISSSTDLNPKESVVWSEESSVKIPDSSYVFIESFSKDFSGYKSPQVRPSSAQPNARNSRKNSFSKEGNKGKQPLGSSKNQKSGNFPKTNVSEVLQEFLKREESVKTQYRF
ncbi:unnamed protein product [Blepharisma stoltei]|uniref:Uncharacterized protein n=1 Tax=Blepharisma stoltei TaxID=1481888 RepID=A0AAU9JR46_9CILI|nr:unnamed protein product [Blepharisma stoltei]